MASNANVKKLLVALVAVALLQSSACSDSLCLGWMPDYVCGDMCIFTGFGEIGKCGDPSTAATSRYMAAPLPTAALSGDMAASPPTAATSGDMDAAPLTTAALSGDMAAAPPTAATSRDMAAAPPQPGLSCFCCCSD